MIIGLSYPLQSMAASDVDAGLDEIAEQIFERTASRNGDASPPSIAISTFTHGDGTCSQLSNYVTEFVVGRLYNASGGEVEIIERSQLSAIFRELDLVYDGTVAPNAAQRVGEISGVDALITGSLIEFGEEVKLQARLISTGNGKLFAFAESSFPVVGTIGQMMANRTRAACGFMKADGAPVDTNDGQNDCACEGSSPAKISAASGRVFESDIFVSEVSSVVYSEATGETSFAVRFQNTSDKTIGISYMPDSMSASDGSGGFLELSDKWSGLRTCYSAGALHYCNTSDPMYASKIPSQKIAQLNFSMAAKKSLANPRITLAFEVIVTPDTEEVSNYDVRSVNFLDVSPEIR